MFSSGRSTDTRLAKLPCTVDLRVPVDLISAQMTLHAWLKTADGPQSRPDAHELFHKSRVTLHPSGAGYAGPTTSDEGLPLIVHGQVTHVAEHAVLHGVGCAEHAVGDT